MNRILNCFPVLVSLLLAGLAAGCSSSNGDEPDNNVFWDIYPVMVYVDVVDAQGNNLLDPGTEGNIVGEKLTVEYEGNTYDTMWNTPWPGYQPSSSRAYLASFHGILHHPLDVFKPASADNRYILEIGELPGDRSYDVTLPVTYKDRTFDIRVVNEFKWVNDSPDRHTEIYLDGNRCSMPRLIL